MRASVELSSRRERRRRAAPAGDARCDRRLPGAGRRRACRGTRSAEDAASSPAATSRRRARRAVRVQRGEARDRPGGHLAVRAREDRPECGAPLLRDRRALRRRVALRIGLVHEVADDLDARSSGSLAELLSAGPNAARAAKDSPARRFRQRRPRSGSPRSARAPRARRACARSSRDGPHDRPTAPRGAFSRATATPERLRPGRVDAHGDRLRHSGRVRRTTWHLDAVAAGPQRPVEDAPRARHWTPVTAREPLHLQRQATVRHVHGDVHRSS